MAASREERLKAVKEFLSAASFLTAVEEQLGLKLEPAVGPVDVLVIDGVQHPTLD